MAASIGVIPLCPSYADRSKQQELCNHMNRKHKAAQYVQRASVNLHTMIYFKNLVSSNEIAYVTSITDKKIVCFCPKFALEGTINVSIIEEEINGVSSFDETDCILRFMSNNILHEIQVFQKCKVCVKASDAISGMSYSLEMKLIIDTSKKSKLSISTQDQSQSKKKKL